MIELLTYGVVSGKAVDPVEKKPLYHFFPGYNIFSVGSYGCNMRCDFCQNWHISQEAPLRSSYVTSSDQLVKEAAASFRNVGIAFTYNEPAIWFEFVRDVAVKIKERGLFNIMVSNGFINPDPLGELLTFTDAFNIDLKSFSDNVHKKLTGADLKPVLETLKRIAEYGRHLEITTLVIPGKNDSEKEMEAECRWIADELGEQTPLHLSRYFPMYKRSDPSTPEMALNRLYEIASGILKYVYLGNVSRDNGQDTHCSSCGTVVTKRSGYSVRLINLGSEGRCLKCGNLIYRNFTFPQHEGH
jgi:pyruvate formate lyase activating enzyme